jgi:butyryl-CoA dehydrogenase
VNFDLTPEQQDLAERAFQAGLEFREQNRAWDAEDDVDFAAVTARMDELGFLGLTMPTEYGGQGLTAVEYLIATSQLFRGSQGWICCEPPFCTTGPGPSIILRGDGAMQQKYVPDLVAGRRGCAIALSEPNHGSDLTHLETTARFEGDEIVVSGEKAWVTGSNVNDLFAVFCRWDDIPGARGVGAVIVERDMPGVTIERGPTFTGLRGIAHGDLTLVDVRLPRENVVGGAGSFGKIMSAFNMERLHNTGLSLGLMEAAFDETSAYVSEREAFGRPILEFQDVYHALVDMYTTTEATRLLAFKAAASAEDGRFPDILATSLSKLYGSTHLPGVTLKALELFGGNGVTTKHTIERIHRDAISGMVAGGAPAVLKNTIASLIFPGQKFPQTRS